MTAKITTLILIKAGTQDHHNINEYYLTPLETLGIPKTEVATQDLIYDTPSKVSSKCGKKWLEKILPNIPASVNKLIVTDPNYYKWLLKTTKSSEGYAQAMLGKLEGYERFRIVYVPSYDTLFKQPDNALLISIGLKSLVTLVSNSIVHSEQYATAYGEDVYLLDRLHDYPQLTVDIEAYGLQWDSSVATIAFAWDQHNGIAIDVRETGYLNVKRFISTYSGEFIFHNSLYDVKLLIRNWWMKFDLDYAGMQKGLGVFENVQDSMLTAYLAKNSTTSIALDLKSNALEFAGKYSIDVKDISVHSQADLLRYNLIDCLATWYVWNKFHDQVNTEPYQTIFQPSIKPLLKMMLVGLPLDVHRVSEVDDELQAQEAIYRAQVQANSHVRTLTAKLQNEAMHHANSKLKTKVKPIEDFADIVFNPMSGPQVSRLLYEEIGLPVLDTTKTKRPSTEGQVLKNLKNHTKDPDVIQLIDAILGVADNSKISGTFIKAFKESGSWVHGNLKLGGTQSGRLSSNSPNLTNLPSKGKMGKLIKSCVVAPDGWLFAGADYSSLEERIGAILSGDPNRIKVYTEGYDGHSLRAYKYYADQMPDIDPNDVNSINSIEKVYPTLRQASKGPTFALQYMGTAYTLYKNSGIPMDQAEKIEAAFHDLYEVSDQFNEQNKKFAEANGFVQCAFGLKLHTPIIRQCVLGNSKTPYAAEAEVRSANNAVTQSWGMLLNRAMIATNKRIEQSGMHLRVLPINMIHDAGYFLVRDDPESIKFLNDTLISEMQWNDHPSIKSDQVPMLASLEIGKSWDKLITLPNSATLEQINELFP